MWESVRFARDDVEQQILRPLPITKKIDEK
jgi:hypothetical protein